MAIQLIDETRSFSEREIEYRREYDPKYNTSLRIPKVFMFARRARSPFSQPEKKKGKSDALGVSLGRVNGSRRRFIMPTLQAYYNCVGRARYVQCTKYAGPDQSERERERKREREMTGPPVDVSRRLQKAFHDRAGRCRANKWPD